MQGRNVITRTVAETTLSQETVMQKMLPAAVKEMEEEIVCYRWLIRDRFL